MRQSGTLRTSSGGPVFSMSQWSSPAERWCLRLSNWTLLRLVLLNELGAQSKSDISPYCINLIYSLVTTEDPVLRAVLQLRRLEVRGRPMHQGNSVGPAAEHGLDFEPEIKVNVRCLSAAVSRQRFVRPSKGRHLRQLTLQ